MKNLLKESQRLGRHYAKHFTMADPRPKADKALVSIIGVRIMDFKIAKAKSKRYPVYIKGYLKMKGKKK